MKKGLQKILKTVRTGLNPTFIVILLVSIGLLFIKKLGNVYTTDVVISVRVINTINSPIGIIGGRYDIDCTVEGEGFRLLKYKWAPKGSEELVDVNKLDLQPMNEEGSSVVTNASMLNALSSQLKDVRIMSISTPKMEITTAPIRSKTVPVISLIEVDYNRRYQQIGDIVIEPAFVEVKSLSMLLDTLKGVYTENRVYSNVRNSVSGIVPLVVPEDVLMSVHNVAYTITVEEFTEMEKVLPIEVVNAPANMLPIIMPADAKVKVNVPLSRFSDGSLDSIRVFVDYGDHGDNIDKYFKVYVESGSGIKVNSVDPLYAELIFEKVK